MLAELGEQYDVVKQTFAEASDALGYDLWALVQNGPAEDLNQLSALSLHCWRHPLLSGAYGGAGPGTATSAGRSQPG